MAACFVVGIASACFVVGIASLRTNRLYWFFTIYRYGKNVIPTELNHHPHHHLHKSSSSSSSSPSIVFTITIIITMIIYSLDILQLIEYVAGSISDVDLARGMLQHRHVQLFGEGSDVQRPHSVHACHFIGHQRPLGLILVLEIDEAYGKWKWKWLVVYISLFPNNWYNIKGRLTELPI